MQGRLHHSKLGANAPKKFQWGGDLTSNLGGGMYSLKKYYSRLAAVIFSGLSDKQIVRTKESALCKTSRYLLTYSLV